MSTLIVQADAAGEILHCDDGLSFWGGVDPATGTVIDVHHPWHGRSLAGKIVAMPTSRGSCSGSGVLLELALNGHAPAALVFSGPEEILTLGAVIAARLFGKPVAVLRLAPGDFAALAAAPEATLRGGTLSTGARTVALAPVRPSELDLTQEDRAQLSGDPADPATFAMEAICTMAVALGARGLTEVSRGHIDGCILAHDANLIFAERMADMGARVSIPTTINAISVDRDSRNDQGMLPLFRDKASRLADAYVRMGARPTFTCAPYLLDDTPRLGEGIGWSESNAVIYANSVLGARTAKLPDYLDLFVAMTGRAPDTGMYGSEGRRPATLIDCTVPEGHDDSLWPLLGWIAGRRAPDRVPLLRGLQHLGPTNDDLRALCAAFGTTSASPLLHVAGVTPEADLAPLPQADRQAITPDDMAEAWHSLNAGPEIVDLVAIGSPHASLPEVGRFCDLLDGRPRHPGTDVIVTIGRDVLAKARSVGLVARLEASGVRVIPDICWCSITEPVFPPGARNLMTNSGKYAHYAPGLSGRSVRFGSLSACVVAAVSGRAPVTPPDWLVPTLFGRAR